MYRYSTALVLCDQSWVDPDLDDSNGIQVRERRDMLRLESQILLVQLHIRKSLMVRACCPVHPSSPSSLPDRAQLPHAFIVAACSTLTAAFLCLLAPQLPEMYFKPHQTHVGVLPGLPSAHIRCVSTAPAGISACPPS
jgi:hypothetical protein